MPTTIEWQFAASGGTGFKGEYIAEEKLRAQSEAPWTYPYSTDKGQWSSCYCWEDTNGVVSVDSKGRSSPPTNENALGIYNMSGNVWEWCLDDFYEWDSIILDAVNACQKKMTPINGWISQEDGTYKFIGERTIYGAHCIRGGAWDSHKYGYIVVRYRGRKNAYSSENGIGLRLARSI